MILENDILRLRALDPEDLETLYKWENNTEFWMHGNTLSPYSKLALRQYISETQQLDIFQAKQLRFMIEEKSDNSVAGTIDLYDFDFHNSKVGVGILIDDKYRNLGYASYALDFIKEYTFSFLRINQLYAYIATDNAHSIRLFENKKFIRSGKLTDWVCCHSVYKDVYIYQLTNGTHS